MSFKNKLKGVVSSIAGAFGVAENAINKMIKENNQYLNAELNVAKESKEGIDSLKAYGDTETPSLKDALNSLAATYEAIEEARKEKVTQLQDNFIKPLNELLLGFKALNTEMKEKDSADKALEKAQNQLEKAKGKAPERLKPGEVEKAESAVKEAESKALKEDANAKAASEAFGTKKIETLKIVLQKLIDAEKAFHEKALDAITSVKEKAKAIKVEEAKVEAEAPKEE